MPTPDCLQCRTQVDTADRFCRHCGVPLATAAPMGPTSKRPAINGERAVAVSEAEVMPAVRADLQTLRPAVVRTVGVLAAAGFLEWAVRRGARELVHDGLGMRRSKSKNRLRPINGHTEVETLVIQQRVSLKQ